MNKCEFSISCPNCHKNPPLILSIQSSLLLNKSIIKSKCSCSKYEILTQDLKDFYIECTLDKKESPSTLKWEQCLSKGQIVSKDAIIESIQNEQNYLDIIYEKLIKRIEAFEDVIKKIKNQVNKLFKWDEGIKKDLLIFCPKLIDDFYISKSTLYTNPMENYVNFNNKSDPVIQRFLKIYPELDYSFKLINKIYFENITAINSLEYYILKNPKSQNQIEAENSNPLSVLKNPVLIPKFGYKFSFDKYQTKFNYSKSFKRSQGHDSTIECIAELSNGNIAIGGNDFLIKIWEKTARDPHVTLAGHTGTVLYILQLKNNALASASADKTIRIWNINNYQTNQILEEHEASVLKLYQLKNSKFISCSVDGTLRIWDPFQSYSSSVLRGHKDAVESCVELEAGVIASCSLDEHIRIWDTYMGKCKMKIRVRKTLIDIDYYITGDLLVISGDKRLMIINYELGNIINEYVNNNEIYCLCHSSDGKIFLGCNKGEVKILNKKFQNITTLKIHNDVVSSMKLFKNQMLATCSWDGSFAISI
jgi:WD40 repeat protein